MKHRLSFAVAWSSVLSKFLTKLLQRSIQAFDRSITHARCHRDKSNLTLCSFFGLRGFGCQFKPDLGHDLGIDLLQGYYNLVRMIAVLKQNGNFWDVDWLGAKVVFVVAQHFNQTLVIRHTGFCAVGKKRQP